MEEKASSIKCCYINHKNSSSKNNNYYYCYDCKIIICSDCLNDHNIKIEYFNHRHESLKDIVDNIKKNKKDIEEQPYMTNINIIDMKSQKGTEDVNIQLKRFMEKCNNLNNFFRDKYTEYKKEYEDLEKEQKIFKEKITKNPLLLINFSSEKDNNIIKIKNIYNNLIAKQKYINYIYESTCNLLTNNNNGKNTNNKIIYEKANINSIAIHGINNSNSKNDIIIQKAKEESKINDCKNEGKKNENENLNKEVNKSDNLKKENKKEDKNLNINNKIENKKDENNKDNENKNRSKRKIEENNIIMKNMEDDQQNKKNMSKNNIGNVFGEFNLNEEKSIYINKKTNTNENNEIYTNKQNNKKVKIQNDISENYYLTSLSNSTFINGSEEQKNNTDNHNNGNLIINEITPYLPNNSYEYLKNNGIKDNFHKNYQNILLGNHIKNNSINNKNKITQINKQKNIVSFVTNISNEIKYIYGISTYDIKIDKRLVVFESKPKEGGLVKYFSSQNIIQGKEFIHSRQFPYPYCRLINLNNEAYVIGGRKEDDIDYLGNNFCFKIYYINNGNYNGLGEIKCIPMKFTNFQHQSHSLLYSNLYKTIFVFSGHDQKKCEYAKIDDKREIKKWEELIPLREPRENALSFLLNEKYIFLVGGKIEKDKIDNSYDMFDFSAIYENRPLIWKTIIIQFNEINKNMFESKGSGIINLKDMIYVFGGYNIKKEVMGWKISFSDSNKDKVKIIDTIEKFDMSPFENNNLGYSFCGDQKFINIGDFYFNIALGGICKFIPKNILNK